MKDFSHVNKIDSSVLNTLRKHNICTSRKTKRGSRGGKRRIPVIISPRHDYIPCAGVINKKKLTHIDTSLIDNNLININTSHFTHEDENKYYRIGCINSQSCRNKCIYLCDIIKDLDIDMLCVTESWLRETGDEPLLNEFTSIGYTTKSHPRQGRSGGGILFVYRQADVKVSPVTCLKTSYTSFEVAAYKIIYTHLQLTVICIYRPPYNSKTNKMPLSIFFDELRDLLYIFQQSTTEFIIVGDLNLHLDVVSNPETVQFQALIDEYGLNQLVIGPTHKSGHTLDVAIVHSDSKLISNVDTIDKVISDHSLIFVDCAVTKPRSKKRTVASRKVKNIDLQTFTTDVRSTLPDPNDVTADSLHCTLAGVLDRHAPLVTRTITDRPTAAWFCTEIKMAKRLRRQAERKWRKTDLHIHRNIFIAEKDNVNTLTIEKKKQFYNEKFSSITTCKELFSTTNALLGVSKDTPLPDGNDTEICEQFSDFFNEKINKLRAVLDSNTECPSPQFEPFKGTCFSEFLKVSDTDVAKCINDSASKSCDLDPIPTPL